MPGGSAGGVDFLASSQGDDTFDLTGAGTGDRYRFRYDLINERFQFQPIDLTIEGDSGTVSQTINGDLIGTDSLINLGDGLQAGSIEIAPSSMSNQLTITLAEDESIRLRSLVGGDTYNLSGAGSFLIDYAPGRSTFGIGRAITANLDAGTIEVSGRTDQINFDGEGQLTVAGTRFSDEFISGAGQNNYLATLGNDTYRGGLGVDFISYERVPVDAVFVNMIAGTATGRSGGVDVFTDTFLLIEEIRGTAFGDDTLVGGQGDDILDGFGGSDIINAGSGNDTVFGGFGRDIAFRNQGDDLFNDSDQRGELGQDTVFAGDGNDTVLGGNGQDSVFLNQGDDLHLGSLTAGRGIVR